MRDQPEQENGQPRQGLTNRGRRVSAARTPARATDPRAADRRTPRTRGRTGLRRRSHALPHRARSVSCRGRTGPPAPDRRRAQGAGLGFWAGFDRGDFIGWWILQPPHGPDQPEVAGEADLGFRLLRRHWRRGYAAEGALEFIRYGFGGAGLNQIFAPDHGGQHAVAGDVGRRWVSPSPAPSFPETRTTISCRAPNRARSSTKLSAAPGSSATAEPDRDSSASRRHPISA